MLATGDTGVLDEPVTFLDGRPVNPGEDSYYDLPGRSAEVASLYDHGVRAILHGLRFGSHRLPLMGSGDWNDGMNLVGIELAVDKLRFSPCLPVDWKDFKVHYRYRETVFHITVSPTETADRKPTVWVDGSFGGGITVALPADAGRWVTARSKPLPARAPRAEG